MRFKDYYQTLGIAPDADAATLKAAYRRLARRYHPDLSSAADAQAQMSEVNEAYDVLGDPARRRAYDGVHRRHGQGADPELAPDWQQGFQFDGAPSAGRSGEPAFSDFFSSLFGRASKPEPAGAVAQRGADAHVSVAIKLADALHGAQRTVTVRATGLDAAGHRAVSERKVQVQIPKGVRAGQTLRLAGQGSAGSGGGPAGDLYLELRFMPDPQYGLHGADLLGRVAVTPWEAALGARIEAPTPAGPVEVVVPPDSAAGQRLRLKGRGLPAGAQAPAAGDYLLELKLALPPSGMPKARALYETMARELADFRPREETAPGARP